jgi:glycosyltransferase involved in cell wall biosynthesis
VTDSCKRLLLLEALPTIAGGQAMLLNLIPALLRQHCLVALLPAPGTLSAALHDLHVPCYFAPLGEYALVHKTGRDIVRYTARFPRLVWMTWRLIQRQQIDLVYANSARTFVWATLAASLAHRPIIWHHHNVLADRKTLRLLQTVAHVPAVQRIICASVAGAEQFQTLAHKTIVIPNGVDTDKYQPDESAGREVKHQLDIPEDAAVIGMVGDLIPLKGHATFLAAARMVHDRVPAAKFLIAGTARPDPAGQRHQQDLQILSKTLGLDDNVIFTGQRTDIPAVLNALNVLVIASTTETGPLVLLESLSSGIPVLSTPVGRAVDLLADNTCGALYPIGDASELATRLITLLMNPKRQAQLRQNARQRAVERLSLESYQLRILTEISRSDRVSRVC